MTFFVRLLLLVHFSGEHASEPDCQSIITQIHSWIGGVVVIGVIFVIVTICKYRYGWQEEFQNTGMLIPLESGKILDVMLY